MRANRRDRNHNEIRDAFNKLGWAVKDVADLKNFCDLLISKANITICIEVKDGEKPPSQRKLTKGEAEFKAMWKGYWHLITCVNDAVVVDRHYFPF